MTEEHNESAQFYSAIRYFYLFLGVLACLQYTVSIIRDYPTTVFILILGIGFCADFVHAQLNPVLTIHGDRLIYKFTLFWPKRIVLREEVKSYERRPRLHPNDKFNFRLEDNQFLLHLESGDTFVINANFIPKNERPQLGKILENFAR